MKTKNSKVIVVFAAVIMVLASSACGQNQPQARIGELQTRSETVELDEAKAVDVDIIIGAGVLDISGGASKLLEADFTYNVADLKPEVGYSGGTLTVHNPDAKSDVTALWNIKDYRYEWDVRLNDQVPMEMKINMGAGSAQLRLGSLSLTRLDLDTGVGQVTVDLTGSWKNDLSASISGGLGDLTVRLPSSTCARVSIDGGISQVEATGLSKDGSEYVNAACGDSTVTLRIDISAGVGSVSLEVGE